LGQWDRHLGVSVHNRTFSFEAISFLLDEPQERLRDFSPHTLPRRSHVVARVRRPPIYSACATHSKETVVRSLRNFAKATFLASLPGDALRSCRSSPCRLQFLPRPISARRYYRDRSASIFLPTSPPVPSRQDVVVRPGYSHANLWSRRHFYLLINTFMHLTPSLRHPGNPLAPRKLDGSDGKRNDTGDHGRKPGG
jgi:hypothetical protein